ncbi:ribonuclease Z [Catalinimonas alkaloidigena]|uniref:Ribonuclease Z n=1 Tax=Catalinimonas alkaloidigena TaxID=1075417 RepID=A0A1G8ZRR5_9BACT|nr:ribonuclease Z [Catalinimonas alkaloidigena]SDK17806.1 ribonuclease Z [Catalinimonas alkaloidigena]
MVFDITILGSNSASFAFGRHQTAQIVNHNHHLFLIDCGEGTQIQMLRYRIRLNRINHIFISHLHGDHYLGLLGLLSTMHLQGRRNPLFLYGPPGLAEIITLQFQISDTRLNYHIDFKELETERSYQILETDTLTVQTLPLDHRIACCGFLFKEKPKKRRLLRDKLPHGLPPVHLNALKRGEDVKDEAGNVVVRSEEVTLPPRPSRGYAYCSDTRYNERLIPLIRNVDLLYHESTFTNEYAERAAVTYHSTAQQAAEIAQRAEVGRLILGHYSSRYRDLTTFEQEAREVFANSFLSSEGATIPIGELTNESD